MSLSFPQACQTADFYCTHNVVLVLLFWGDGVACFKRSTVSTQITENIASKFSENRKKSVKCIFRIFQVITDFIKKYDDQIRGAGAWLHVIQAKVTPTEKGKFIPGNVAEIWNQASGRKKEASTEVYLHF